MRMLASAVIPATAQIMLLERGQCYSKMEMESVDELIQGVQLLGGCVLFKKLAGDLALGGQNDAILG
jgi:hypothetical protein